MKRRNAVFTPLAIAAASLPMRSFGQQGAPRFARIGFLSSISAQGLGKRLEAFRQGLREVGYEEGKNILVDYRYADGRYERLPDLARELVRLNVDVILTGGTPPTRAAQSATTTIPIVMTLVGDAIAVGVVASLARPGGNVTGGTFFLPELCAKRLQLLKEAVPSVSQVAVFVHPDNRASFDRILNAMEAAAAVLGVKLHRFEARRTEDFDLASATMSAKRVDGLVAIDDSFMNANAPAMAALVTSHRLPSIGITEFAESGGLIAYGVSGPESWRRAGYFVEKILKGAKPGDIPVEQPTKFELTINLKSAKALGLTLPQSLLLRADEVIQ